MMKNLFAALAALVLGATSLHAQLIDVAIQNNGTNTTITVESTGAAATASASDNMYDGFNLENFMLGQDGISNFGTPDYSTGFYTAVNTYATSTLASESGFAYPSITNDGRSLNFFSAGTTDSTGNPEVSGSSAETWTAGDPAFTGDLTWVINDADYGWIVALLPTIGAHDDVLTGYSSVAQTDIGSWQVVRFSDLPSEAGLTSAAPEPRSWALAAVVALGFLAIWRRKQATFLA
jgi:hypothetical protein